MLNRENVLRALKREAERYSIHSQAPEIRPLDFLFLFSSTDREELELVQKMGGALKLSADRWSLVTLPQMDVIDLSIATRTLAARNIILFGAPSELQLQGPAELIRAPHLSELLRSPDQKRLLWEKLKAALARL